MLYLEFEATKNSKTASTATLRGGTVGPDFSSGESTILFGYVTKNQIRSFWTIIETIGIKSGLIRGWIPIKKLTFASTIFHFTSHTLLALQIIITISLLQDAQTNFL